MEPNQTTHALYQEVADEYANAMQRLARATEANADRRRDLLQEMHFQLWKSLSAFDGRCSRKTWTFRVIHNVAASHVSREKRISIERVDLDAIGEVQDLGEFITTIEKDDALARLHAWIRKLKTSDRQLMTLYLEDLSGAEMSEVTGLKPGAIATRISRLKSKLTHDFKEASQ